MAKYQIKFQDVENDNVQIEVFMNSLEIIEIVIDELGKGKKTILLDKSTAIKFAKTLRAEINKITESEVNNG